MFLWHHAEAKEGPPELNIFSRREMQLCPLNDLSAAAQLWIDAYSCFKASSLLLVC